MSDPVIIGGGPAGSAAAIAIARAGRPVTLIERSVAACDKVCGDFLSVEAIAAVETLGIDLSIASSIGALRLIHRDRVAATRLPFSAQGLTRRALDEALLRQVAASGATVLRGHRVRAMQVATDSLRIDCDPLGEITTGTVFLATGKHELRGQRRGERGGGLVGLKMYYKLAASQLEALRHHVELVLFAGGYAGLQLVECDRAVLCMLVPASRMRAVEGRWQNLLDSLLHECPHLGIRLGGAHELLERPLAVTGLPYGYVYTARDSDMPSLFRLGDQAAVIASLTGDGVGLALAGGALAARTWLAGASSQHYHKRLAAEMAHQMRAAKMAHRLCLTPILQPWIMSGCKLWPGVMRWVAAVTRSRVPALTHPGHDS